MDGKISAIRIEKNCVGMMIEWWWRTLNRVEKGKCKLVLVNRNKKRLGKFCINPGMSDREIDFDILVRETIRNLKCVKLQGMCSKLSKILLVTNA